MSTFFVIKISKFVNHVEDRGMSHYMKIRKVQNWTSVTVCFMTVLCDSKCCKLTFIFFQTHTNTYRKSKKATAGLFGDGSRPLPVRPSSGPLRPRGRASPITCLPLTSLPRCVQTRCFLTPSHCANVSPSARDGVDGRRALGTAVPADLSTSLSQVSH